MGKESGEEIVGLALNVNSITVKSADLSNWVVLDTARYDNYFQSFLRFDTMNVIEVTNLKLKKSYENGKNWIVKDTLPKNGSGGGYFNLLQINNTTALLGSTNKLYKTVDKGETWQKVTTTDHLGQLYRRGNLIYSIRTIGTTYTIAKSIDDGNTWQYSLTITIPLNSIHFQNRDTVFAYTVGNLNIIYRSYDGGNTFKLKDTLRLMPLRVRSIYFVNNKVGFISTGNNVLLKSCDGGSSWTENSNTFFISDPNQFYFINDIIGIALAHRFNANGGYLTLNQGGACPTVGITKNEQRENPIIKVYPNPTTGSFTIANNSSKEIKLILYDVLGRILLSSSVEARSEKHLSIHLPPAVYFIKGDNGFYSKLLVKE